MKSNKKILIIKWKSFGLDDVVEVFLELGYNITLVEHESIYEHRNEEVESYLKKMIEKHQPDCLFSLNYYPVVSFVCNTYQVKYISLVYDSPHIALYAYTIIYPCNYIFIFDSAMYEELKQGGISTVYYMPLPVNTKRVNQLLDQNPAQNGYDVAFVGSLYNEEHNLYDRLQQRLEKSNPYLMGYLDGLVRVQSKIYGYFFLEEMLTEDIVDALKEAYPYRPGKDSISSEAYVYAHYFLSRKVTELERMDLLKEVSQRFELGLYTYKEVPDLERAKQPGKVDYYTEMPMVFRDSKINLNITLKSIRTGIPLRAMDIMGAGGFLLTNYQADFFHHFVPDEDFVYYSSKEDMMDKIAYFLAHEKERREIAQNGKRKIESNHNYRNIITQMLEIAGLTV